MTGVEGRQQRRKLQALLQQTKEACAKHCRHKWIYVKKSLEPRANALPENYTINEVQLVFIKSETS